MYIIIIINTDKGCSIQELVTSDKIFKVFVKLQNGHCNKWTVFGFPLQNRILKVRKCLQQNLLLLLILCMVTNTNTVTVSNTMQRRTKICSECSGRNFGFFFRILDTVLTANSKHWFTTSFLQPLLYLVTP